MNMDEYLAQWEDMVCDRCGSPCDFDGLWRLMGATPPQHKCKDLHAQAGHLGTAVTVEVARLTKERDNARELVRLFKELRKPHSHGMVIVQAEIMKRALGDDEYDVLMKKIAYAPDWAATFIEEIERLDSP